MQSLAYWGAAARRLKSCCRGVSAIEFALISPIFIGLLLGIVTFGVHFGAANSVQQLSGDIARAAVAGIDEAERVEIANAFLHENIRKYAFLSEEKLTLTVADSATEPMQFDVALEFDASELPSNIWAQMFNSPPVAIRSVATVRHGGF